MLTIAVLVVSIFSFASAGPVPASSMVLHEKRGAPGSSFVHSGPARGDEVLNLRIALKSRDMDGLDTALLKASTPGSPNFRQWLNREQVESFARPSDESFAAVTSWLAKHGLNSTARTPSRDWISISVPVTKANAMLNAKFSAFVHADTGARVVRTLEYSLPEDIAPHVRLVHPTVSFIPPLRNGPQVIAPNENNASSRVTASSPGCESLTTPGCLQQLYNLPVRVSSPTSQSRIVVSGYGNQFANEVDLRAFLTQFRPDMSPDTTFSLVTLDDGTNSQDPTLAGKEANLDIQYALAVGGGLPTTFLSVGADTQDGDDSGFLDTLNALLAEDDPPQTFTTSYGFPTEQDLSVPLTLAICDVYKQLTARGVSVIFATGDGGVAAAPDPTGTCTGQFRAAWPTCPFVTMVGATGGANPEQGADLSAGGFSYIFDTPAYQSQAVAGYLDSLQDQFSGLFNPTGRAYPDVSAQGARVSIASGGEFTTVAGTSASAPMFAGIIALLNDELLAAGQPVLGFLNPWLYANPQMFNDIVGGSNPGCGTDGFPALQGWDPVTGLGTPNYPLMRAAAGLSHSSLVSTGVQALLAAVGEPSGA